MTEINRLLSLRRIEQCLNDVRASMGDNQLKVNDDKTVALVLTSRNNRANHNITVIKIGDCDITPSPTGRNIGVIFDTEMSMVSHVKHVCCISYYHLRNIASIRSCLTQKSAVRLVYSLVISSIYYANCLLYDLRATRVLRSTTNNDFYMPPSRSRYGDRMFSVTGPRLWNSLPAEMKKTSCIVTLKEY